MSVTFNIGAPVPSKLATILSNATSFTDALAALNLGLVKDYLFGTSATGSAPVIPITNLTDLATYFNAFPDAVGTASENAEVERFQAFNTTNHVFNANDLTLTAALESGGNFNVIALTLTAPTTASTVLTVADTTGLTVGNMFATSDGTGTATAGIKITALTSTTITISSSVTLSSGASVQFLPIGCCGFVTGATNVSTLTFTSVSPAVVAGMFYNNFTGATNGGAGTRRVVSTTSTTVTLDGTVSCSTNDLIFFSPPVTSGQIWSKDLYQPGKNGTNYLAFEFTSKIPANPAQGAWPAHWFYQDTAFDASEIDIPEFFYGKTSASNAFTSNIHGGSYNVNGFRSTIGSPTPKWDSFGFFRPGVDYSLAAHKWGLIWAPDKVYRYIDGALVIVTDYLWSSHFQAQLASDLAMGSYLPAFLTNYFYPQTTAQFPVGFAINEIKIWQA